MDQYSALKRNQLSSREMTEGTEVYTVSESSWKGYVLYDSYVLCDSYYTTLWRR